jgi:hypothetical protein
MEGVHLPADSLQRSRPWHLGANHMLAILTCSIYCSQVFNTLQTVDRTQWKHEVIGHEELFLALHNHLLPEMI